MHHTYLDFEGKIILVNTNTKVLVNHINALNISTQRKRPDFIVHFFKDDKEKFDLNLERKELIISQPDLEDVSSGYKYYNTLKWLMRILNLVYYPDAFSFHASSFSYKQKGFLASSVGLAGKSTFAILASMYGGEYINDEYSFVKFRDNNPYVFGYPEIGAHIRIGTKRALKLDYSDELKTRYNLYNKGRIFRAESDDSKIDVNKLGKTARGHKLDYVLFLNIDLDNNFSVKKIPMEEAAPMLRLSLLKHVFKLLFLDDILYTQQNVPAILNKLEKRFGYSSIIINQFIDRVLKSVECYKVSNNLEIKDVMKCLNSLTK